MALSSERSNNYFFVHGHIHLEANVDEVLASIHWPRPLSLGDDLEPPSYPLQGVLENLI